MTQIRNGWGRHSEVNDWSTPRWLFDALDARIGFGVDACAGERDALCPVWIPDEFVAARMSADGSLTGAAVWCNPPYGRRMEWWVGWARGNGAQCTVCLLPVRTSTGWWHAATPWARQVVFIRGRLQFGGSKINAPFDSAVLVFGDAPVVKSIVALRGQERVVFGACPVPLEVVA